MTKTPVETDKNELDRFNGWAARFMRHRLDDGARKFGALSWRNADYTDDDNAARLVRGVDHLLGVLRKWRDPATAEFIDATELAKRAADVANQAFMLADQQRQEGDEPFTFRLAAIPATPDVIHAQLALPGESAIDYFARVWPKGIPATPDVGLDVERLARAMHPTWFEDTSGQPATMTAREWGQLVLNVHLHRADAIREAGRIAAEYARLSTEPSHE